MVKFSIIIPTFNSEKYIKSCLDSIFNLNYSKDGYEVIVVDGGSKDNTLNIIKKYEIKLLHSKNISIANSRNLGAKKAKGENLIFVDSDCVVDKELLNKALENLKEYVCCGSFYKSSKSAGWVARTWLLVERKKKSLVDWIPAGNLVINRKVFQEIRGFNERLQTGEDFDLCFKLKKKGYEIYNDPKIAPIHLGQTDSLKDFFKKEMWRGNSLIKSIKEHGITKEETPSTVLTLYHLFAVSFFVISLFLANIHLTSSSLFLLIIPSFLLSSRKTFQTRKLDYFFNFYIALFIYQMARSFSIIRYNQFKDIIKTSRLKDHMAWITWEKDASIRSAVLAKELKAKFHVVVWNKILFLRYFVLIPRTISTIVKDRPKILFVQNPSLILSSLAVFMKNFFDYYLVMDLHTIFFQPSKFSSLFFNKLNSYSLKKSDLIIVTNSDYKDKIEKKTDREIVILPDKIPDLPCTGKLKLRGDKNIICICSFSRSGDEPHTEIIKAAKLLDKNIFIYMTGNYKNRKTNLRSLPENIILTGFLDIEKYRNLINSADAIMVLTECDDCLVCGGYEAVSAEKPMILSNKKVLIEYFSKGAIFTNNNYGDIAKAVYNILNNNKKLKSQVKELKIMRSNEWQNQWQNLLFNLENVY